MTQSCILEMEADRELAIGGNTGHHNAQDLSHRDKALFVGQIVCSRLQDSNVQGNAQGLGTEKTLLLFLPLPPFPDHARPIFP